MKYAIQIAISLCTFILMFSCTPSVPKDAQVINKDVSIFPDYTNVTIPYNIAPLNFHINDDAAEYYVAVIKDQKGKQLVAGGQDVKFDESDWHNMLKDNKSKELSVTVYVQKKGIWMQYKPFKITVAEDFIDEYISYRIIEPSYQNYNELTLCQRHLTDYNEVVIFSNKTLSATDPVTKYQCINCHSYQNYHTNNFQFHIRQYNGGTMIIHNGKIDKINLKTDSTIAAGVYPSWHPTEPIIAYSVNNTVQTFLINDAKHKIEVIDTLSDLIIYHVNTNEVQIVQKTVDSYETFPSWAPSGDMLYYCSAYYPIKGTAHHYALGAHYDKIYYDIIRQSYDVKTSKFGEPDTVFKASAIYKSASQPRISPDGRYLLFSLSNFGYFNIHHVGSDLCIKDLKMGNILPLKALNSDNADSFHSWSSNGRWILFSSRREDGNYTRLFISYFDKNGKDHKAFVVPQKDPLYDKKLMKSFNVPEFMVEPVGISARDIADVAVKKATAAKLYK